MYRNLLFVSLVRLTGSGLGPYGGDLTIYNGGGGHYQIRYAVTTGSGMLRVMEGNREGTPATSLTTSSGAKVVLDMRTGSNTVTAQLLGTPGELAPTAIYIYGSPQLTLAEVGEAGGDGIYILTVTLKDSSASFTGIGVVGVPIKFDVTEKSLSGGTLIRNADTDTIVDASK